MKSPLAGMTQTFLHPHSVLILNFIRLSPVLWFKWIRVLVPFLPDSLNETRLSRKSLPCGVAGWEMEISYQALLSSGWNPGVSASLISPLDHTISSFFRQQQLGQPGFDPATRRQARVKLAPRPLVFKPREVDRGLWSKPLLKSVKIEESLGRDSADTRQLVF